MPGANIPSLAPFLNAGVQDRAVRDQSVASLLAAASQGAQTIQQSQKIQNQEEQAAQASEDRNRALDASLAQIGIDPEAFNQVRRGELDFEVLSEQMFQKEFASKGIDFANNANLKRIAGEEARALAQFKASVDTGEQDERLRAALRIKREEMRTEMLTVFRANGHPDPEGEVNKILERRMRSEAGYMEAKIAGLNAEASRARAGADATRAGAEQTRIQTSFLRDTFQPRVQAMFQKLQAEGANADFTKALAEAKLDEAAKTGKFIEIELPKLQVKGLEANVKFANESMKARLAEINQRVKEMARRGDIAGAQTMLQMFQAEATVLQGMVQSSVVGLTQIENAITTDQKRLDALDEDDPNREEIQDRINAALLRRKTVMELIKKAPQLAEKIIGANDEKAIRDVTAARDPEPVR